MLMEIRRTISGLLHLKIKRTPLRKVLKRFSKFTRLLSEIILT